MYVHADPLLTNLQISVCHYSHALMLLYNYNHNVFIIKVFFVIVMHCFGVEFNTCVLKSIVSSYYAIIIIYIPD